MQNTYNVIVPKELYVLNKSQNSVLPIKHIVKIMSLILVILPSSCLETKLLIRNTE